MKKSNLIAKGTAIVLAMTTMLSTATVAYAEDSTVTDKPLIDMVFENEVATKKMSEEDAKIFAEAMGYGDFSGEVQICSELTSADIDWTNSAIPMEEVYFTAIIVPDISRDASGNLVVSNSYNTHEYYADLYWYAETFSAAYSAGMPLDYFDKTDNRPEYRSSSAIPDHPIKWVNDNMAITTLYEADMRDEDGDGELVEAIAVNDIFIIRICYTTDGLGNCYGDYEGRKFGYSDFLCLADGVESVLNLGELEGDTSDSTESSTESKEDTSDSTEPSTESKEDNQDSTESTTESKENTLDSTESATDTKEDVTTDASEESSATEETTTVQSGTSTPDTGDNTATLVYLILAVSALGAILVTAKMKRA